MKKLIPYLLLLSVCLLGAAGKAYFDNIYLNSYADFGTPSTTPATSAAGTSRVYYDSTINGLKVSSNAGATPVPLMNGRNKIINGNFNVWQRGTGLTGVATSASTYLADRWQLQNAMTGTVNESQTTNITGVNGAYNAVLIQPNATSTVVTGSYLLYGQIIEGYNLIPLNNQVCTLSFWAKGTAGTYGISFRDSGGGGGGSYVLDWVVPDTNMHQYVYTFTHSNAVGTWVYTSGAGINVSFNFIVGATYQQTTGSWQAANKLGSSAVTNTFCNSTSNSMIISQVQLEAGPTATQFEQLDFQTELARCQRYYESSLFGSTNGGGTGGFALPVPNSLTVAESIVVFKVTKRATPTIVFYDNIGASGKVSQPGLADGLVVNSSNVTTDSITGVVHSAGYTAGYAVTFGWTASADF